MFSPSEIKMAKIRLDKLEILASKKRAEYDEKNLYKLKKDS